MTDRPTGLTVTLPLVWRDVYLFGADIGLGWIEHDADQGMWRAVRRAGMTYDGLGWFKKRAEAERAVEAAVMKALKP